MERFFVCRAYLKWKGKMYYKGDLLPVTFTHHDKARSMYNSRIGECDVKEEQSEEFFKEQSAIPTPITKPLTGNVVVQKVPLEVESFVVPDEVPEMAEVIEVAEINEVIPTEIIEASSTEVIVKGTVPAAFNLLTNFTPGTQ
jgi:hypothetical protein